MVVPEILTDIASRVLYDVGHAAWRAGGTWPRRLASFVRRRPGQLVFVPEAAGLSAVDVSDRKLVVRLILLGSSTWTNGKPVELDPAFTATLMPPGNGGYFFARQHRFTTAPVPRGMHAYFIGEHRLSSEHACIDPIERVGVLFDGHISIPRYGRVPIFPVALLAGTFGAGGGFRNEPIELAALRG